MVTSKTYSAVAYGQGRFEFRELRLPKLGDADGILRVEACGVCGSDLKKYLLARPPTVLGHETVGVVEQAAPIAEERWGVLEGDRVLLEEYLPCGHCRYCRGGEFRSCAMTDNTRVGALRYGSTPVEVPPGVWGGYSRHQYLHPSSVLHRVPDSVSSAHATFAIPLSNGIQWAQYDGGVRAGDAVLVLGPGQQGIACVLACRQAGASQIFVSGLTKDAERLDLATKLGATRTIDIDREDVVDVIHDEAPEGSVDLVIDVSGGGISTFMAALRSVRVGGTVVIASGSPKSPGDLSLLDLSLLRKKRISVRGARGHSFEAVERALSMMSNGDAGLDLVSSPPWALADIGAAMEAATSAQGAASLHTVIDPWREDQDSSSQPANGGRRG
ncbi:alcohol dehydrogenase catalytic domain-containing protein [Nocardioides agariphilus]|jgi:threonine dehydrogenase-like Zn-dependent dehydrogenase|uniref:Alcohol dehydrogenase catalytic domain-containing protein n=1 Tax=Nocardioides agariphilus TaxID=433664 RepID=A0A930VKU6_9ACTN|nr:alcohol dehydrogenase catalytic domain-containing protein [Nocardioides agariphilus]MBF4769384.1 alcohol dehydrogenase catalytic domain-containing protein [Nocardioides agariphilus]